MEPALTSARRSGGGADRPLIHVGYHKTGTGWLQKHLFSNPQVGFAWTGKRADSPVNRLVAAHGLDFRAEASAIEFGQAFERARAEGLSPVVSLERLSGHPFSGGYDSREIADRLAAAIPDGRILMVVREQVAMIASTYKQYVKAGGALKARTFLEPPTYPRPRIPHFDLRHFEYDRLFDHYVKLFGQDRVLALPYEQLAADPTGFVERIVRFAGLAPDAAALAALPLGRRQNASPSAFATQGVRLLNRLFLASDVNPAPILRWPGAKDLLHLAATANGLAPAGLRDAQEERLRGAVVELARGRYGPSNARLSASIGCDLAGYGYEVG